MKSLRIYLYLMKPSRKQVGIIPGGFKPYTKGHHFLVTKASSENDLVYLLVGKSDRVRPGQVPIMWSDMQTIWSFIEGVLPSNVKVAYVSNPVGSSFEILQKAEEKGDNVSTFKLYGDPEDLGKNFTEAKLSKYVPSLSENDQIIIMPVERTSTGNISGTMMRQYLQDGNRDAFIDGLPAELRKSGIKIFKILSPKPKK